MGWGKQGKGRERGWGMFITLSLTEKLQDNLSGHY